MASRNPRRHEWRKANGTWTCSLGSRGMRVRLFQNRRDGTFYRATWIPGVGRDVASLRTKDRAEAERCGRELLAELLRGAPGFAPDVVTLGALWERFHRECPTYLDNAVKTKRDASSRVRVLFGHFGEACDVRSLTTHHIGTYAASRRAGGIVAPSGRVTGPVRARSVEADIVLLNTMLAWATTVRTARGHRWLAENPLRGMRRIREQNPHRPIATWERYERTRTAMQELGTSARSESERNRWLKLELALVLAEGTGRRLSAIRQLRWEDFHFERGTVRWRAEADKKRREQVVPLPEPLLAEIRSLRLKLGSVGGWIFARASDGIQPMDRHLFDH